MLECSSCHSQSALGTRFCSECGAPLDPFVDQLKQSIALDIQEKIRSVLKTEYADKQYVEIITSQAIAERLLSWAKLFATVVAVPLAISIFILGFLGFRTYSDFSAEVKIAQKDVETKIQSAQVAANKLQADSMILISEYDKVKENLNASKDMATQVQHLAAQYKEVAASLDETKALSEKLKRLDVRVTGIEDSIKIILVVGNQNYIKFPRLKTPSEDARAVGAAFGELGFKVTTGIDLDYSSMNNKITEYIKGISPGDTVVLYYSGHGIGIGNESYLVQTDVDGFGDHFKDKLIGLEGILKSLTESNARAVIVFLDACRNNPLSVKGFVKIDQHPSPGMLVVYAASPGEVALDGLDGDPNSLFTSILLKEIKNKDEEIVDVVRKASNEVVAASKKFGVDQHPAFFSGPLGPIYLAGRTKNSLN
jgi:hypothetical protein